VKIREEYWIFAGGAGPPVYPKTIYISDYNNSRIVERSIPDLAYVGQMTSYNLIELTNLYRPQFIKANSTHLFIWDNDNPFLFRIDKTDLGATAQTIDVTDYYPIYGMGVDDNYIYLPNYNNDSIVRLDATTMAFVDETSSYTIGMDTYYFYGPENIHSDGTYIYITSNSDNSVVKVTAADPSIGVASSILAGNVDLSYPEGVCVDGSGNVYIADSGWFRIVKLNSSLQFQAQGGYGPKATVTAIAGVTGYFQPTSFTGTFNTSDAITWTSGATGECSSWDGTTLNFNVFTGMPVIGDTVTGSSGTAVMQWVNIDTDLTYTGLTDGPFQPGYGGYEYVHCSRLGAETMNAYFLSDNGTVARARFQTSDGIYNATVFGLPQIGDTLVQFLVDTGPVGGYTVPDAAFFYPYGITTDNVSIYVADVDNNRVSRRTCSTLAHQGISSYTYTATDVYYDGDNLILYVTEPWSPNIEILETDFSVLDSYVSATIGLATGGFIFQDAASQFAVEFPTLAPGDFLSASGFADADYNRVYEVVSVDGANQITCVNPFSSFKIGESGNIITLDIVSSLLIIDDLTQLTAGIPNAIVSPTGICSDGTYVYITINDGVAV
jgi:hypothetical protein